MIVYQFVEIVPAQYKPDNKMLFFKCMFSGILKFFFAARSGWMVAKILRQSAQHKAGHDHRES